jgi:transposase
MTDGRMCTVLTATTQEQCTKRDYDTLPPERPICRFHRTRRQKYNVQLIFIDGDDDGDGDEGGEGEDGIGDWGC